jgi:thymidylate synthase (FAD)
MSSNVTNQGDVISVLDKGFIRYIDHMGSDLMVVNAARVSFNKQSDWEDELDSKGQTPNGTRKLSEKDKKLVEYLAKHNHWTPFAHPQITLHIKSPIAIRAQLGKHQVGFVMNEVSRRYVKDKPEVYVPKWRSAPTDGAKQGSSDFLFGTHLIEDQYCRAADDAVDCYMELLRCGVAPEQARFVLPQGTFTEWHWTGSLAAYARVCKLRLDPHAQWEVREYAAAITKIIEPLFPHSWKALLEYS